MEALYLELQCQLSLYQKPNNCNEATVLFITCLNKSLTQILGKGNGSSEQAHITDDKHVNVIHMHYEVSMSGDNLIYY